MKSTVRRGAGIRRTVAIATAAALALPVAACSSSSSGSSSNNASGPVTITVGCEPPTTQKAQRQFFLDDIAAFEKANPNITVKGDDANPCEVPAKFTAQLAAGTEDNVFYTAFTDPANVIAAGQAADIQSYVGQIANESSILPQLLNVYRQGETTSGDLYGIPVNNYSEGLVYNTTLFKQAGIASPPATWAEVEADAKKISALGSGYVGYVDLSAQNTGGWHFAAELYSRGGQMVTGSGSNAKAAFDTSAGLAVLQTLHQMRFVDNDMGTKQGLAWQDPQQLMSTGKLGMYVGAPDTVTNMHATYNTPYTNIAMAPLPGVSSPTATLLGGDGYMFNKKDTPAQIVAGIKFLNFEFLTPNDGQFNYTRTAKAGQPVGLPEPDLFTAGSAADQQASADEKASANVPSANFSAYTNALSTMQLVIEPPQAQAIYAQGDKAMYAALTNPNANLQQLLDTFSSAANEILQNQ
ncbi:extracellular solute-binding protein [Actinospica sp. MGRD01-02]|uniref:Extracellular solute-binding protein n=1 Tax=Actinospica acidithermotolerans TaxID=2828514 RepID=A0A941E9B5_9ACTN|nr:extracellular solute-binding protein [Actinospica acidithermotolerans]MBR7826207.1 extracellular solute-binding protein [Actinospica acidithermotolerans]